jgi:hypothetical protein
MADKKKELRCTYCGSPITHEFLEVCDDKLCIEHFKKREDNIFCDIECLYNHLNCSTIRKEDDDWPTENDEEDTVKDVETSENT